jgi:hypothetical protein
MCGRDTSASCAHRGESREARPCPYVPCKGCIAWPGELPRGHAPSMRWKDQRCTSPEPCPARSAPPLNRRAQDQRGLSGERSKPHGGSLTRGQPAAAAAWDLHWRDFSRCLRAHARPGQIGLRNPGRTRDCIRITLSSSGCRKTSRTWRRHAGRTSRQRTPWWASDTSPGSSTWPPPISPTSAMG